MRDLLKGALGRSLRALQDEDRLAAAWLVACGRVLAEHGTVVGYADGIVRVEVSGAAWLEQFKSMRTGLETELAIIADVPMNGIHFVVKR